MCSTKEPLWRRRAHNMEERVESKSFFLMHGFDNEEFDCFVAISPRQLLDGTENKKERIRKLSAAMLGCKYVYPVGKWYEDGDCNRLMKKAKWLFKTIIPTEVPL